MVCWVKRDRASPSSCAGPPLGGGGCRKAAHGREGLGGVCSRAVGFTLSSVPHREHLSLECHPSFGPRHRSGGWATPPRGSPCVASVVMDVRQRERKGNRFARPAPVLNEVAPSTFPIYSESVSLASCNMCSRMRFRRFSSSVAVSAFASTRANEPRSRTGINSATEYPDWTALTHSDMVQQ